MCRRIKACVYVQEMQVGRSSDNGDTRLCQTSRDLGEKAARYHQFEHKPNRSPAAIDWRIHGYLSGFV